MISYLRGSIIEKTSAGVALDVNGVGYFLSLSNSSLGTLPPVGREVALHAYLHVREDSMQLFGFATKGEKQLFESLIGVSGIGPKVALAVLSAYDVESLKRAIVTEDIDLITAIPGIGKKTAQRLVLELREKIDMGGVSVAAAVPGSEAAQSAAHSALLALGYTAAEARAALQGYDGEPVVEEMVKYSLQKLAIG
ncbi:MAG: Holliday junction branch migration protein RuvA [Candidatus Aquicultorales bacterium]